MKIETATNEGRTLLTSAMQTQNYIRLWRIVRQDSITNYYTDHDENITMPLLDDYATTVAGIDTDSTWISSVTWESTAGLDISAERQEQNRSSTRNVLGMIEGIPVNEIQGGAYDMAEITEWVVDARWPFLSWFRRSTYWVTSIAHSDIGFAFDLEDAIRRIREHTGHPFNRTCRWTLGMDDNGDPSAGCGQDRSAQTGGVKIDIDSFTWDLCEVTHVAFGSGTNDRMSFNIKNADAVRRSATLPQSPFDHERDFKYGKIVWTTGNNIGLTYEIADYDRTIRPVSNPAATSTSGQLSSRTQMQHPIVVGDVCTVIEGCDNSFFTCNNVYDNRLNYGGYNLIPGPTKARQPIRN